MITCLRIAYDYDHLRTNILRIIITSLRISHVLWSLPYEYLTYYDHLLTNILRIMITSLRISCNVSWWFLTIFHLINTFVRAFRKEIVSIYPLVLYNHVTIGMVLLYDLTKTSRNTIEILLPTAGTLLITAFYRSAGCVRLPEI